MRRVLFYSAIALIIFSCVHNGSGEHTSADSSSVDSTGFGGMQADSGTGIYNKQPIGDTNAPGNKAGLDTAGHRTGNPAAPHHNDQ